MYDGQDAVTRFSELVNKGKTVDLIITDFMMPRLNGIQVVEKIRGLVSAMRASGNPIKEPRFVFLTSYKT